MRLRIFLCISFLGASRLAAQDVTVDSLFDEVDQYWRRRVTLALPSSDTLVVTCEAYANGNRDARVRLYAAEAWSDDAVATMATDDGLFLNGMVAYSRIALRWSDGARDNWRINFLRQKQEAYSGISKDTRLGLGQRSGSLANGEQFLQRLSQTEWIALRYPTGTWYRSSTLRINGASRAALVAIRSRCLLNREGAPAQKN